MVEERTPKHQTHSKETLSPNTNSLLCHLAIQRMLSIEFYFLLNSLPCIPSQDMSKRNAPILTFSSLNLNLAVGRGLNVFATLEDISSCTDVLPESNQNRLDWKIYAHGKIFTFSLPKKTEKKHILDLIWFDTPRKYQQCKISSNLVAFDHLNCL